MKHFAQALCHIVKEQNKPAAIKSCDVLVNVNAEPPFKDYETCSCKKADSRFDNECTNCGDMFT